MSIMEEAELLVNGERRSDYGPARQSFDNIAAMWSVILGQPVTAKEVALCMVALKLVRELGRAKRDNLVDACGYLRLIEIMEMDGK